jgi:hydrogenase assembly chaperone HypC/HupF
MCLGAPARIVATAGPVATVEVDGKQRPVNVALLPNEPAVGDWVLVHLGFAIEPLAAEDADAMLALQRELEDSLEQEVVP